MSTMQPEQAQTYRNVMESLVVEEVEKQFQKLPVKVASYVNKAEVVAYALNRLPPFMPRVNAAGNNSETVPGER